ncbi:uncharacterized protein LOC143736817 isoform X2 [Siphateles boraxobius]|uniref:uncharacterized protein LOC143707513 isoform X2 n=1 Tax=Siphateles boraxobius TaxID=180520 RepID=UPI004064AE33
MSLHSSVLSSGQKPQYQRCPDPGCTLLHCPFCPQYKGDYARVETHMQSHLKTVVHHGEFIMYRCNLGCRKDSHYHCCGCGLTFPRRNNLLRHLSTCQSQNSQGANQRPEHQPQAHPVLDEVTPTSTTTTVGRSSQVRRVQCTKCAVVLNKKNLKQHMRRRHPIFKEDIRVDRHLACECLDTDMGIYAVLKSFNSNSGPIHVQKKTSGTNHQIRCALDDCIRNTEVMHRSGFVTYDCAHIQSLKYCPPPLTSKIQLEEDVLREIVSSKWFSEEKKKICLQKQAAAREEGIPFSIEVQVGSSSTRKFVSVYEPHLSYCNQFGRMMVMFDLVKNTWHCHCATGKQACIHKCIAKWDLFQTMKEHFENTNDEAEEEEEKEEEPETEPCFLEYRYPPQKENLKRVVKYIHRKKKLPADLPSEFCGLASEAELPMHLIPKEQLCPECTNVPLSKPFIITKSAKIISLKGVVEGVTTYSKKCNSCGMIIRYQEWKDGVHNFDDRVILTLHFCIYLRNCLQTHTALGRAIETCELTSGQKYPNKNTLIHGYLHFEALTDHNYDFACVRCGHHPPIVVMDLHKNCVFSMAVSELENPPDGFDGKVDIGDFWDSVCLERIARAFVPSDRQNPFQVQPTYNHWAPWIGSHTRKSNMVLNTEHEKVHMSMQPNECREMDITEDRLLDEISNLKVHAIRKLCKECGIDSRGSKMELILRLREEMATRSKYDKVFQKVWGASGGWAVVMCPCGQVVSLKCNIRAESPRDFTDLLLSWKHMPNISIYDFARGLAVHANLREPEVVPFSPHEGRLLDPSPENLQWASKGGTVSLPWLKTKKTFPDPNGHPLTGSEEHYCLYDTFHERNTKDPRDILRRLGLVPELAGRINSQVAEQLFSIMKKNNYFMNMLSPSAHVFTMRNIIHHYNQRKNKTVMEELRKLVSPDIPLTLNEYGQAEFCLLPSSQTRECDLLPDTHVVMDTLQTTELDPNFPPQCQPVHPTNLDSTVANWKQTLHARLSQALDYVLDINADPHEPIVLANSPILKRSDFWTLGLERDIEATIANCCFNIITNIANAHVRHSNHCCGCLCGSDVASSIISLPC